MVEYMQFTNEMSGKMEKIYNHIAIEKKWKQNFENIKINKDGKPKYYCLDMFPYPSASGLHVGHWRGYVFSDVISRYKMLLGYNVLHPMGFDAFGLPTENFAIKQKIHPEDVTKNAIKNYKRQLKDIGAIYNWENELSTTNPDYYKWTQWIFLKMFEAGLAYEKEMPLNWCPSCKIVKSNEEVKDGICDRCNSITTKKMLRQWMLKITNYSERLLTGLEDLNWPYKVKKMQSDWIGKSYGASIQFEILDKNKKIEVYTTRPDTIFGATFILLSPEHPLISDISDWDNSKVSKHIVSLERLQEVKEYIEKSMRKSTIDRMSSKDKTGVFTGLYCLNPLTNKKIPVWISDYVLSDYGTGAIMAVPAHDERDNEFAKNMGLEIIKVIESEDELYTGYGNLINSNEFNGQTSKEATENILNLLEQKKIGRKQTNYKLRDWVFSRQRYWGEPIPLIHCENCGIVPVRIEDLPVTLPKIDSYLPTDTGESPLASIESFVNCKCPKCEKSAKRETNTMPQWAGSSWYFLRYPDSKNEKELLSKEALENLPVDMYVGGIEHAVLHLLYARFYTKFLYDIGVINFEEPFTELFNQGMVLKRPSENEKPQKMSKSQGNIVNPDEVIEKYGRDTLRMYILFMGPAEIDVEWDDSSIEGVFRYINKLYKLVIENKDKNIHHNDLEFLQHKFIEEITNRIENFSFNTVISGFMEYTNKISAKAKELGGLNKDLLNTMVLLISPFAPFVASELWQELGNTNNIFEENWPKFDIEKTRENTVEIALQINGKVKKKINISTSDSKDIIIKLAKKELGIENENTKKEVYVPNRIVNIVL